MHLNRSSLAIHYQLATDVSAADQRPWAALCVCWQTENESNNSIHGITMHILTIYRGIT